MGSMFLDFEKPFRFAALFVQVISMPLSQQDMGSAVH